jgi:hypothetical protein
MDEQRLLEIISLFAEIPTEGGTVDQLLTILNYWRGRAYMMQNEMRVLAYEKSTLEDQLRMWDEFKDVLLGKLGVTHPEGMPLDELVFPIIDKLKS